MYALESTHTFASSTLEDARFVTAREAWLAAAEDYASSDHGEDESAQADAVTVLSVLWAPGPVTLPSGEIITVRAE
jgi:hypothetical protein